ncbi:peptidoglycan DD-metalloendopeptidase family protein [Nitrosomonas sp.]|uniref:peptidoglycan DD-metalloendopeptidase family protein n=1 Tax=Nitrosomonas sp. TaxID=42353 RepID=UPI0025CF9FE1|nr:peptidoglycan DD-metalloendopeptidase family protein [Nitrosomonas sp.]
MSAFPAGDFQNPLAGLEKYWKSQGYNEPNPDFSDKYHIGEDWTSGTGDSDIGDSIRAADYGVVVYRGKPSDDWGNVVIIQHTLLTGEIVSTIYAHLEEFSVSEGDVVIKGMVIGTLGNADNYYPNAAHLHFGVYLGAIDSPGAGYSPSKDTDPYNSGYVDPSYFLENHSSPGLELSGPLGGNDTIYGGKGNDGLSSLAGTSNTFLGRAGDDTYVVQSLEDIVLETTSLTSSKDAGGIDTVISSVSWTLASYIENLILAPYAMDGTGNSLNNTINGNEYSNVIKGLSGIDTLIGGAGIDTLNGGTGNDTLIGGIGKDLLVGGPDSDIFDFNALNEMSSTTSTADTIIDFSPGVDKIDLSTLDANATTPSHDAFTLITAFEPRPFIFWTTGQVMLWHGVLYGNTDNDIAAEFAVNLTGISSLTTSDLILYSDLGSTFTLTNSTDNITGTSKSDIFIGDNVSTSAGDTLNGGSGTDTLKIFGTNTVPNISGIEQLYYNAPGGALDLSAKSDVTSIEVDGFGTQTLATGNGQVVKLTNQVGGTTATLAGNTPTSLALTLDKAGSATVDATVALTGTALTQLDVTASGNDSYITLTNAGAKLETINIAGAKTLDLQHALTTVKTINAGTATGNVLISGIGASNLAFTGGSGNDMIVMGATITASDVLKGGTGTDTLSVSDADTVDTAAEVIGLTEFETFEVAGADATTYNLAIIGAENTLTGLVISETGGRATVSNINAATTGNISITGAAPTTLTLTASDFVSGGTSDTATISLDNSTTKSGTGIDVTSLVFANADVINLKSIGDGSSTKTVGGAEENSVILTAADVEKVVINGDEALSFATATGTKPTEVDASGLTNDAAVTIDTDASAITSLLVKSTGKNDTIDIDNAATVTSTLYLGGGSDTVTVDGGGTDAHTLIYTATALNAGDIKAGNSSTLALRGVAAGDTVTINFSSALEALLKSGSTLLSATGANINVHGTTLSATSNIAAAEAGGNMTLQIDLNGDGAYAAADDYQLTITGTGLDDTFVYIASTDTLVFTVV